MGFVADSLTVSDYNSLVVNHIGRKLMKVIGVVGESAGIDIDSFTPPPPSSSLEANRTTTQEEEILNKVQVLFFSTKELLNSAITDKIENVSCKNPHDPTGLESVTNYLAAV
jgi:hypothetical protein